MELKNIHFDSPVIIIGWRGHPINRFCVEIIERNGDKFNRTDVSQHDFIHGAYCTALEYYEKAMVKDGNVYQLNKWQPFDKYLVEMKKYRGYKIPKWYDGVLNKLKKLLRIK